MNDNIDLSSVGTVTGHASYNWNLRLEEFNGQCRIYYSTNCPLLAGGYINLVTTSNFTFVAVEKAKLGGGFFDTGESWGSGWYAMWSQKKEDGFWTALVDTPATK